MSGGENLSKLDRMILDYIPIEMFRRLLKHGDSLWGTFDENSVGDYIGWQYVKCYEEKRLSERLFRISQKRYL